MTGVSGESSSRSSVSLICASLRAAAISGTMTANGSCGTEGKASENADDGDDGKELDEGERIRGTVFVLVE